MTCFIDDATGGVSVCVSDCNDVIMFRKSDVVLDCLRTCVLFSTSDGSDVCECSAHVIMDHVV